MLKIVNAPNPVLSQSSKRIFKVDKHVQKLIEEMKLALLSAKDPVGVGLAAPQVGVSLQIFIAKPTSRSKIQVFINPKIIAAGGKLWGPRRAPAMNEVNEDVGRGKSETGPASNKNKEMTKLEGCLSLPNIWGEVKRNPTIQLQYQLITDNYHLITKTQTFSGFTSTIIQHEIDHLNGILFPKRVLGQKGILYKSHKEKGEDIFEEIEI